eukprot:6214312-Pleurochrysis_carterae.AAC.2
MWSVSDARSPAPPREVPPYDGMWPETRLFAAGEAMEPHVSSETTNGSAPMASAEPEPQEEPPELPLR